jgi:hypothetical protein
MEWKKGNPILKNRKTKQTNNKTYEMKRKTEECIEKQQQLYPHSETFHSKINCSD